MGAVSAALRDTTILNAQWLPSHACYRAPAHQREGWWETQYVEQRRTKVCLEIEIESDRAEELSKTFMRTTRSLFPPPGCAEQWDVITCRNARCLKLGVRKRKRTFSLRGVCDPVFYFPIRGSRSREG